MLEDSNRHLEVEIEALREENAMLRRMLFGRKSEKVVHEKIGIEEVEQAAVSPPEVPAKDVAGKQVLPRKKSRRLFATITKEIEQLVIPEEVLENPLAYTRLPESSDRISRRLEYVPGRFELHIFRMPAFVKKGQRGKSGQDAPIHAATPQSILPGSNMGASIIALALHNKYSLHLPLYRQIKEFERIRPLYTIERTLRESKAPPERKLQERMEKSRPIVEAFFNELTDRSLDTQNPPRNKLKDAIDYALKRRSQLCSRLKNPCIPIDNNQVERVIRPVTVGRKNSLFIGSPDAGQRAAIIYTMVEECKRTGTDFQRWLTEVLRRLPTHRAADGYLSLLPGILNLAPEKTGGKKVTL